MPSTYTPSLTCKANDPVISPAVVVDVCSVSSLDLLEPLLLPNHPNPVDNPLEAKSLQLLNLQQEASRLAIATRVEDFHTFQTLTVMF